MFDRVLLALLRWKLSRCRAPRDAADKFSDALVALLSAELARRHKLLDNWERRAAEAAAVAEAMSHFQNLESGARRLQ